MPGDLRPVMKLTKNKTRKTTNNIQAIWVAVPAIPLSPSTPAMSATTRNVTAQLNITIPPSLVEFLFTDNTLSEQLTCHRIDSSASENFLGWKR